MSNEKTTSEQKPKVLGLQDILSADDKEYAEVPGFKPGEVFRIQSLTAGDLIEWTEAGEGEAKRTAGLRLIVKSLVNEHGERLMTDEHLPILRQKSHKVTERIAKEILKLNGMNVKGAVEEAKKD